MRYAGAVILGLLASTALFASQTCPNQISPPPALQEPPPGFRAAQATRPKPTPQAHAQVQTPTRPAEVAQAPQTPGPTAAVPDDFPKDVPIYKDATVTQVQNL